MKATAASKYIMNTLGIKSWGKKKYNFTNELS